MRPPRTIVAPVPSSARHSSRRGRASARPGSAELTGSTPGPARAPVRNVRLLRSLRYSRCFRRWRIITAFCAVVVFPVALLLQCVRDFLGHVGLIVLGKHGVGPKHPGAIECTFGHNALPLAEQ